MQGPIVMDASKTCDRQDKLDQVLGKTSFLIHPAKALVAGILLWLPLGLLSGRWVAMAWCCWSLVLLATALWLERPWLNRLPLPPITVLTLAGTIRWGLGAGLLVAAGDQVAPELKGWAQAVEPAQALWGIVSTAIVLAGLLNRPLLRRLNPAPLSQAMARRLPLLVLVVGCFTCSYLLVGMVSGTLDRSNANYIFWTTKLWRADTLFAPFMRLRDFFPLLLPLAVQTCLSPSEGRPNRAQVSLAALLIAMGLLSLVLGGMSGGRALLIFPLLLMLCGLWMTKLSPLLIRGLAIALLIFSLVFIPLMATLRESPAFQATSSQNLVGRGAVVGEALIEAKAKPSSLGLLGRELFPSSDPFLFHPPGSELPAAGNQGLGGLLYLWIPKHLYPNRPEINDGHLIAKQIMGQMDAGVVDGQHVWFPNVTLGGDLYRRYRWPGVVLGAAGFGLFYALMARIWYQTASLSQSLFAFLLAIYPASFIDGVPLRSVSETIWNWFWEFPKYLLVMLVLSWFVEGLHRLMSRRSISGADA
jgi:hypothetical protein